MPKGVKAKGVKVWPLLTGTIRYEKTISTRGRGHGEFIDAPILAYLIATPNGRILYDVGCDYRKISHPALQAQYFYPMRPAVEPPKMGDEQRIPRYLARLGLCSSDIDVVFVGHLHFDHVGGLCDFPGCEVHIHADELAAAARDAREKPSVTVKLIRDGKTQTLELKTPKKLKTANL